MSDKKYVEKVLNKYTDKQVTKLEELRDLDKKASRPATLFASIFGAVGSLVLGFGMCVAMEVILPGYMLLGIIVGLVGIYMVSINYYIYKKMLASSRAKYADQIKELSDEILNK